MLESLTSHLEAQQEPLKKALGQNSFASPAYDEGAGGYPFGKAIDDALWKVLHCR